MHSEVYIRKANEKDIKEIFLLSNFPDVRKNSINSKTITWQEHVEWFERQIKDENCLIYIAEIDGIFAGTIRYQLSNSRDKTWIVSISVHPNFRRMGIASQMLSLTMNDLSGNIIAFIKPDNNKSIALFEGCGFVHYGNENFSSTDLIKLIKQLSN